MEFHIIDKYEDFCLLEDEWEDLLTRIENPQVFYKFQWAKNYLDYYIPKWKNLLCIVVGYENKKLIALFPFVLEKKVIRFITSEKTDYNMVYVDITFNRFSVLKKGIEYMLANERKYHILKDRLSEEGKAVFVAEISEGNTIAGYFCTSVTDTYVGGIKETLTVPVGTLYLFDDYVFEEYRGKRIHQKSICYRMQEYLDLGYTRAMVCIYHTNDTSAQSYLRNGFQYDHSDVRIVPLGYKFSKIY